MISGAGLLAVWLLAAGPAGYAESTDEPRSVVVLTNGEESTGESNRLVESVPPPASRPAVLPADPVYDVPGSLSSAEGIPGLPPDEEEKSSATTKEVPPQQPTSPTQSPPADTTKAGEALLTDEQSGASCGECSEAGFARRWLGGLYWEGWLAQGFTVNTLSPRNRSNGTVGFNDRSNDYQLNQLYMRLGRDIERWCDAWDLGGRVDLLYGTDSVYTVARGLEVRDDLSPKWNAQRYGLAMPQCYMEVYSPWGNGLSMKLGHFYSTLGYETVTAPDNFFYSHSYARTFGEPYTHTGFLGETTLGAFTILAGMTRGWDNWEDNNNDLGFLGGILWTSPNQRTHVAINVHAGREQPDPNTSIRTIYSLVIQQDLGERWQCVIQHDFGQEPDAGIDRDNAAWYGLNQYLFYTINDCWRAGLRFEWFRDEGGTRIPGADRTADYFQLCPGLNWTPNDRLVLRTELRWDWTGTSEYYPFGDETRSHQLLWDLDLIVRF